LTRSRTRLVIAGGGFAALEAALALRALAGDRLIPALVSPEPYFTYRPAATTEAFDEAPPMTYELSQIASDLGAEHHRAALARVVPQERYVELDTGKKLDYDFLVLAVGAHAGAAVPGALTFRDQRDLAIFKTLLDEIDAGVVRRVAFAVPSAQAWSLPAYELAFLTAAHAARGALEAEIVLVTPEPAPLAVFGSRASRLVAELLDERGIRFVGDSIPHAVQEDGSLALEFDAALEADRVVAVPEPRARRIAGVPSSWAGFVPTDETGRVEDLADVYAAGDITTYPIKQGGIAAQQADVVAQTIAAQLGASAKEGRQNRILRARLLSGDGAVVLRAELDALGRPTASTLDHRESRLAGDLKVFGLYLTPYLSIYRSRLQTAV
jgi:sulfide:quinone oxidoreductase